MNRDEAKKILLRYRPGTRDAVEPEVVAALAEARSDRELAGWLEQQMAGQRQLAKKFRQIASPAGLKEQIISEHVARLRRRRAWRFTVYALSAVITLFCGLAIFQQSSSAPDDTLAVFRNQMTGFALRGYNMDLLTTDAAAVRAHLARQNCPADFKLPAGLQTAALTGCAVAGWQDGKAAMVCFRTGKPLPPGQASDLWLFVVDRKLIKNAPLPGQLQLLAENRLITATWTDGDKVYLLETDGNEAELRKYL